MDTEPLTHMATQRFRPRQAILPGVSLVLFWSLGIMGWRATGFLQPLVLFGYIGTALGIGVGLYTFLPKRRKQWGRRFTLLAVGGMLLVFMGIAQRENLQIEWLFLSLLAGLGAGVVMHYAIAKVLGPLLIGRLWCGWACWTLMVLDLLDGRRQPAVLCRGGGHGVRAPGQQGVLQVRLPRHGPPQGDFSVLGPQDPGGHGPLRRVRSLRPDVHHGSRRWA